MRAALLLIGLLAGVGCTSRESDFVGQIHVTRRPAQVVMERSAGTLVALASADGAELWRYRPQLPRQGYLDLTERYRLVCPLAETPDGQLLLRYDHEIHSISRHDGRRRWKANVYLWAYRRLRCPAVTPDSGVLLLRRQGIVLQKLDSKGRPAWTYRLVGLGAATHPPVVSAPSGDALLQTASHLVSVSPQGALNWAVRRPRR